ncbi:MAG TPA: bifunctional DNA-formamidopyrimidine glycosylase/DNA-(apurinic or apyrimidinic site) lyase [Gemmataceae bacterium]|nr:bifunctional DNA-formamidopyrimidine glycosylase/DNA-(apurinic or apyrimidinic site) lyase [Gemmataceae bacterium]
MRRITHIFKEASGHKLRWYVPELPEVETVVRDLRPRLAGKRILSLSVSPFPLRREWSAEWEPMVIGRRIQEVRRRGKWIILDLDGDLHLVIHLGMTGQLRVMPADAPVGSHTHIIAELNRGQAQLRFRDVRRFGSATLFQGKTLLDRFFQESKLGPEPFDLDTEYFRDCLLRTKRCLKAVLLDQCVVAGVGNIYADESLFQAKLHPAQLGQQTTAPEARRLQAAIVRVLNRAIERRGSSIRDYIGGSGEKGGYQREFRVYGQVGKPCPRCKTSIMRTRLAGRSTHFCPRCQQTSGRNDQGKKRLKV